ncbi:MAG: AbrB/MazE/SpoVT family DNA-binding domain-containing protein [bacterium]|nr:AbrB/MazE/SpoVT family DNA-binding domain-containing protein [bacterium]
MRITSKGQVTIPKDIRDRAGLLPDSEVEFVYDGNVVTIRRAKKKSGGRGEKIVQALRGRGDVRMTTDEIIALMRDK